MNYKLLIPNNTSEKNAAAQSFDIARRVIHQIIVHIPDGHKYLSHFQIKTRGKLIVPEFGSSDEWIEGNNHDMVVSFPGGLVLDGPPYEITLRGWNEDDTYDHTFHVEVS
jgi:hypothetical protein